MGLLSGLKIVTPCQVTRYVRYRFNWTKWRYNRIKNGLLWWDFSRDLKIITLYPDCRCIRFVISGLCRYNRIKNSLLLWDFCRDLKIMTLYADCHCIRCRYKCTKCHYNRIKNTLFLWGVCRDLKIMTLCPDCHYIRYRYKRTKCHYNRIKNACPYGTFKKHINI